jgi:ComF family protein
LPAHWGSALLELIAPSVCPACDQPRRRGERLVCPECAVRIVPRLTHRGAITAAAYEGTVAELIRRLKFEGRRDGIPVLTGLVAERVAGLRFEGIVPVPRHWRRIRDQGCDPVHDLARMLSHTTGRPVWEGCLRRSRLTRPQTDLSPPERRRNPSGSFRARGAALNGRTVLLFDDVTTTGATLHAAARALRRQGAARRVLRVAVAGTPTLPI